MRRIAAAIGVSPTALYVYFADKNAIQEKDVHVIRRAHSPTRLYRNETLVEQVTDEREIRTPCGGGVEVHQVKAAETRGRPRAERVTRVLNVDRLARKIASDQLYGGALTDVYGWYDEHSTR